MADSDRLRPTRSASPEKHCAGAWRFGLRGVRVLALTPPSGVILFTQFPEHADLEGGESNRRQDECDH